MNNARICLNMIVKNEAHVICETFDNLLSYIKFDYWVISDTGSTDGTQDLIQNYFKDKGIKGELVEHEWKDFGYNRTKALESAYNKSDFLFIFDADDKIEGEFKLPLILNADMYQFKFGKEFTYLRPLFINNRKKWRYRGVLHEFLEPDQHQASIIVLNGNYYVDSRRLGDRNKNPFKYRDDANILKNAYEVEKPLGDAGLSSRYAFYCAQSYKDAGMPEEAIEWYKKSIEVCGWAQEKYYSALMIGSLLINKGELDEALKYFYKTVEFDNERMEGAVTAMEIHLKRNEHLLVNALYHRFKNYNQNPSELKLFVSQNVYKDRIEYLNSISASYANDKESGYLCCKKLLLSQQVPVPELCQTVRNFNVYREFAEKDSSDDIIKLFEKVDKLIFSNKLDDEAASNTWKFLYEKRKEFNKKKTLLSKSGNFIKIVNLPRRDDRKKDVIDKMMESKIEPSSYEFIKAVDGKELQPNFMIKHLFRENDFKYRRGVLGCAFSHLNLWEQLLQDPINEFYVVLEDDITLCKNFKEKVNTLKPEFLDKDVVFLGYHMWEGLREKFDFMYSDNSNDVKLAKLVQKMYMGGTFAYSINKLGAKKLLDNAKKNGIKRAIDFFMFDTKEVDYWETRHQLVFSKVESSDSDIQKECDILTFTENNKGDYVFLQGIDQVNYDIMRVQAQEVETLFDAASNTPGCVGFNTLGYLKNGIHRLEKVQWFSEKDGIFIKRDAYEDYLNKTRENIEIEISEK
jgi:GR25 family glycosyltransferase involved in LPS biosynthesis/tetratricopeptide (TPR) repeat protein